MSRLLPRFLMRADTLVRTARKILQSELHLPD
jgi:hypothetical protein